MQKHADQDYDIVQVYNNATTNTTTISTTTKI